MFSEKIYTLEQLSENSQVPLETLEAEIAAGRLQVLTFAGGVRRFTESSYNGLKALAAGDASGVKVVPDAKLEPISDFSYVWPNGESELYTEAREGVIFHDGKKHRVKIGFTIRKTAGQPRRRSLVLIDGYPSVECVSADDTSNGMMASVVKNRDGKHLPVGATLPPEYRGLPVAPYRDIVTGPGASNGLAVMSRPDDFETMIRHALIRYHFRQDRK
jgi:hypothetical protein